MIIRKNFTLLFLLCAAACSLFAQESIPVKKKIKTIVIDPGHGGKDPGALGTSSSEAEVSLAVSMKLGKAIHAQYPDIKIIYTRTSDILPGNMPNKDAALKHRARIANESGADLFISIHCNSAGAKPGGWYAKRVSHYETTTKKVKLKKKWVTRTYKKPVYEIYWVENTVKGTESYIWAVNKNNAKTNSMIENHEHFGEIDSTSTLELPDPADPAEKARLLVYTQRYFRKSLNFATWLEDEFVKAGRNSRGVKQRNDRGIWVLQATGMPSVLIELGFITNKQEEAYLNSEDGQAILVNNMLSAFQKYVEATDGTTKTTATTENENSEPAKKSF